MPKQITVAVTGAAGQIGYALLFRIAAGEMFGKDTRVDLRLLELEKALPALQGVVMELDDCAFPLLNSVTTASDPKVAFKGADFVLLVGSVPRKEGMERGDLLKINGGVFIEQGKALSEAAKPTCKEFSASGEMRWLPSVCAAAWAIENSVDWSGTPGRSEIWLTCIGSAAPGWRMNRATPLTCPSGAPNR